jgi:hypothetical protein
MAPYAAGGRNHKRGRRTSSVAQQGRQQPAPPAHAGMGGAEAAVRPAPQAHARLRDAIDISKSIAFLGSESDVARMP